MKTNEASLKLAVRIRKAWSKGEFSYREIADHFDVDYHLARRIILGKVLTGSFDYPRDGRRAKYRRHGHLFIIYADGRVWSTTSGRFLDNWNKKGYKIISMKKPEGGMENILVSRIMLTLFVREPKDGDFARHLDDDTRNNNLSNLAWGSKYDNAMDSVRNGTKPRGEFSGVAKLNDELVRQLAEEFDGQRGYTTAFIERHNLDVVPKTLHDVLVGKTWRHVTGFALRGYEIYLQKPLDVKAVKCLRSSWVKSSLNKVQFCSRFVGYLESKGYTGINKHQLLKALNGKIFSMSTQNSGSKT